MQAEIRGTTIQIDEEDFPLLAQYNWRIVKSFDYSYVQTAKVENKKRRRIYLHHLIAHPGQGQKVTFRDGDHFNLQRANLVLASQCNIVRRTEMSEGRFRELYLLEKRSPQQIAVIEAEAMGRDKPVSEYTIKKWLKEYKIPIRSKSESMKIASVIQKRAQKGIFDPSVQEVVKEQARIAIRLRYRPIAVQGKVVRAISAAERKAWEKSKKRKTIKCLWCQQKFEIIPAKINEEGNCCSREHMLLYWKYRSIVGQVEARRADIEMLLKQTDAPTLTSERLRLLLDFLAL